MVVVPSCPVLESTQYGGWSVTRWSTVRGRGAADDLPQEPRHSLILCVMRASRRLLRTAAARPQFALPPSLTPPPSLAPPRRPDLKGPSDFHLSLGRVIEVLRNSYPLCFAERPDMSIYSDAIAFHRDPDSRPTLRGIDNYQRMFDAARVARRTMVADAECTYRLHVVDDTIRVRWLAKLWLRLPLSPLLGARAAPLHVDGVSVYELGERQPALLCPLPAPHSRMAIEPSCRHRHSPLARTQMTLRASPCTASNTSSSHTTAPVSRPTRCRCRGLAFHGWRESPRTPRPRARLASRTTECHSEGAGAVSSSPHVRVVLPCRVPSGRLSHVLACSTQRE